MSVGGFDGTLSGTGTDIAVDENISVVSDDEGLVLKCQDDDMYKTVYPGQ